jgi:hypothetical protein
MEKFENVELGEVQTKSSSPLKELERWIAEHVELCKLSTSLSFSQQKAAESYKILILNSANYGKRLIDSMMKSSDIGLDQKILSTIQSNLNLASFHEKPSGNMIPLSGYSRFEDRSLAKKSTFVSAHSSSGLAGAVQVSNSPAIQQSPLPSKTYLRRPK